MSRIDVKRPSLVARVDVAIRRKARLQRSPREEPDAKPNDAILFDLLADWAPDEAIRNRILVDNPTALYGFD
jgi:hypothetical protein